MQASKQQLFSATTTKNTTVTVSLVQRILSRWIVLLILFLLVLLQPNHSPVVVVSGWKFRFHRGLHRNDAKTTQTGTTATAATTDPPWKEDPLVSTETPPPSQLDINSNTIGNNNYWWWSDLNTRATEAAEDTMEEAERLVREVWDHLRPPPLVRHVITKLWDRLHTVLMYKPPVGVVAALVVSRLIWSGRILRLKSSHNDDRTAEDELISSHSRSRDIEMRGRSFVLDGDDQAYWMFGGIERIRRRLCLAAVHGVLEEYRKNHEPTDITKYHQKRGEFTKSKSTQPPLDEHQIEQLQATARVLQITTRPTESCRQMVRTMIEPVSKFESIMSSSSSSTQGNHRIPFSQYNKSDKNIGTNIVLSSSELHQLIMLSSMTAHVRTTDVMVRLLRNRVLQTTYRLARTVQHWERRQKQSQQRMAQVWHYIFRPSSMEEDRLQLSLAQAAYHAEITRLGNITKLLMERPDELPETALLDAIKATEERYDQNQRYNTDAHHPTTLHSTTASSSLFQSNRTNSHFFHKTWQWMRSKCTFSLPFSKYSLRWKADHKGILSIRRFDVAAEGFIDVPSAIMALQLTDPLCDKWMTDARSWTLRARNVVCQTILGSWQSSTGLSDSTTTNKFSKQEFETLHEQWCQMSPTPVNALVVQDQWRSVIRYVDTIPSWRRIGEGQKVRLRDAFRFMNWASNWDFLGIPSSLMTIYGADVVHERLVKPYWAKINREGTIVTQKAIEIFKTRTWEPLKGIYDDIMNRSPTMMSALGLEVEEMSLDHMLRDLNFGDGTPATRQQALKLATEQYDQDIANGLFGNIVRGRLIRLMLVQVQQLKVGMLSALDTIDVLIKGNRIHFKLLAAIPAIVITTYGTRYMMRVIYNLRAKDIRPVTAVHSEMLQYLVNLENLLLLSDDDNDHSDCWATQLQPSELGELVLSIHRYLILLDYSSPPFLSSNCNVIHQSLQEFLGTGGTIKRMKTDRQIQWLSRIKEKHQELLKNMY